MTLVEILTICVLLLTTLLIITTYKLYQFSMVIIRTEDAIEECLDVLDERYGSIASILDIPVFFDSVEVRRVINDINVCRDSLVLVANKLTQNMRDEIETKEES